MNFDSFSIRRQNNIMLSSKMIGEWQKKDEQNNNLNYSTSVKSFMLFLQSPLRLCFIQFVSTNKNDAESTGDGINIKVEYCWEDILCLIIIAVGEELNTNIYKESLIMTDHPIDIITYGFLIAIVKVNNCGFTKARQSFISFNKSVI